MTSARSILSHLIRGNASEIENKKAWEGSPTEIRDKVLLDEIRRQAHQFFTTAAQHFCDEKSAYTPQQEQQFSILLSNLLAAYPLLETNGVLENLIIPQKIAGKWHRIEYQIKKLDVSPRGLLGRLLDDEDRIYTHNTSRCDF